ncbi:pantothenate kinase, partial [Aliarcobacter butzleri]
KKLLKKNPKAKDIKEFLNFETKYQGLGIDSKIACSFQKDVVVVDAGSAITVDIMENDVHKGGFILLEVQSFINAYP